MSSPRPVVSRSRWLVGAAALVVGLGACTTASSTTPPGGDASSATSDAASPAPQSPETMGTLRTSATPPGAGVLDDSPGDDEAGRPADTAARIVPAPDAAEDDVPDFYADGCQLGVPNVQPRDCVYGVAISEARATIAVVGDSKAAQWVPALEAKAREHRWRIEIYTKSACSPVPEPTTQDGKIYRSCILFNRAVTRQLTRHPVDLVLTTGSRNAAVSGRDDSGRPELSKDLFVRGLAQTWRTWARAGNRVLVVSDTPKPMTPGTDDPLDVPDCVAEHTDDLTACAYDRADGIARSGYVAQEAAVKAVGARDLTPAVAGERVAGPADPDVSWVDLVPWVCPSQTCAPVIGDVLVYRNGSHLTTTYVETLAPRLEAAVLATGVTD